MDIKFSIQDEEIIEKIEQKCSSDAGFSITLISSISSWENLINECRDGYDDVVEEFTNDLASRDIIQQILDVLSKDGVRELSKFIESLDSVFLDNTIKVHRPIMKYEWIIPEKHFWYFRVPKRIEEDELSAFESQLEEDLSGKVEIF